MTRTKQGYSPLHKILKQWLQCNCKKTPPRTGFLKNLSIWKIKGNFESNHAPTKAIYLTEWVFPFFTQIYMSGNISFQIPKEISDFNKTYYSVFTACSYHCWISFQAT